MQESVRYQAMKSTKTLTSSLDDNPGFTFHQNLLHSHGVLGFWGEKQFLEEIGAYLKPSGF